MLSIVPCRSQISDRFPIASFDIGLQRSRYFEVACATDPRLFHTEWKKHRTASNFFSSRGGGLLRATQDHAAWFLPPAQLRRFAGARRIYYALGSYGSPTGCEPQFTISPHALDQVPSISLSADFTGRTLDRSRLLHQGRAEAYGSPAGTELRWGGDDVLEAERATNKPIESGYDDGYTSDLWEHKSNGNRSERALDEVGARNAPVPREHATPALDDDASRSAAETSAEQAAYDVGIAQSVQLAQSAGPGHDDDSDAECHDEMVDAPSYGYAADSSDDDVDEDMEAYDRALAFEADEDDDGVEDDEGEVEGYEDAAALYGAVGYEHGEGGVAILPRESLESELDLARYELGRGRDADYREEDIEEEVLPAGAAGRALNAVALDIAEKVRITRVVARAESGSDAYTAINPDNEYNDVAHPAYQKYHMGLSWGLIQFTQRSGALGRVLAKVLEREQRLQRSLPAEHTFAELFGPDWEALLRVTNDPDAERRVGPVGGLLLWEGPWIARFRAAGSVPHVTWAQNEVALTDYFDPQLRFAKWLGFDTARALAMLLDRCIHMGNGGGLSWVMRAVGPVQSQADRESALRALGKSDVRAFQESLAPHLNADGRWRPQTHAAMTAALRDLGSGSPLAVADRETMLQRMVDAARGSRFHKRVKALFENQSELPDTPTYVLV